MYLEDYRDDMPDLETLQDLDSSVYDWLGATPASTTISTDTEATNNMFGLSMGMPEPPASHDPTATRNISAVEVPDALPNDESFWAGEQFWDMFNV